MDDLIWTKEKPIKIGWYWYKDYKSFPSRMVEIIKYGNDSKKLQDGWDVAFYNGFWAGPIQEPKEEN